MVAEMTIPVRFQRTSMLDIAYEEHGPPNGSAIVLLHGFPYDPRCYDAVAPALAAEGYRVIVPLPARLWTYPVCVDGHHALRPAGGLGMRPA